MPEAANIRVAVVVATYNKPLYLRASLTQLLRQNRLPDQIVIADDGSDHQTKSIVDEFAVHHDNLLHIWHQDDGFQKCQILNKAIAACDAHYVIFTDDDCLCTPWFVSAHLEAAKTNAFTVGASVNLDRHKSKELLQVPKNFSDFLGIRISQKMRFVETQSRGGYAKLFLRAALTGRPLGKLFDKIYLGRGVFRGGNSGAWRDDLIKVNGFNNDMVYGHEDREIGERLRNLGLSCRQVRYYGSNFHLNHDRSYADPETKRAQRKMCKEARSSGTTSVANGIELLTD